MAVTGASKLTNRLRAIRASTAVVLTGPGIPRLLLKRTKERFLKQVDPDGAKWKPLAAVTRKYKREHGQRSEILRRTDTLFKSIAIIKRTQTSLAVSTGAGFSIGVAPSFDGEFGGDPSVYGRVHQFGAFGVPTRRFLGISRLDVKAVDSLMRREILAKNGLGI